MSYDSPSIGDLLIATLCSARSTRRFYAIIREREFNRYKENSVRVSLSRLHKKGYLTNLSRSWSLTKKGKLYARDIRLFSYLPSPFEKNSAENTIVSFDIPEPDRFVRNWLRNQIKIFGYKMLQQSLWIGPGPLPSSFLVRLKELKIREKVKIFSKAKKSN
jgi:phenylacetic acid degradation operon negative regulatory protein